MVKYLQQTFLTVFTLLFISINAQDVNLQWSEEFNTKEFEKNIPILIGSNEVNFLGYYVTNKEITIVKFDRETFTKTGTFKIPFKFINANSRTIEFIKFINDRIYMFSSEYNKSDKIYYLYCSLINTNGEIEVEDILVDNYSYKNFYNLGYNTVISEDSSKLILSNKFNNSSKEDYVRFGYKIINLENLETISVITTLPYKDKYVNIKSIMIDKNNEVWINASIRDDATNIQYSRILYCKNGKYEKAEEVAFENTLNNDNQYYHTNCTYSFDDNGNILCIGNYGQKSEKKDFNYTGFFSIKIDKESRKIVNEEYKPFDNKQIEDAIGRYGASKTNGITGMKFKYKFNNGKNTYMVFEVDFTYQSCTSSNGPNNSLSTITCITYQLNNSIFIVKTIENGSIEWVKSINKYQVSNTDINHSFIHNETFPLKFIYLDRLKRFKKKHRDFNNTKKYIMHNPSTSMITYSTINENGDVMVKPLLKTKVVKKFVIIPQNCIQLNENEVIVLASKKNKFKFIKVQF